MSRRISQQRRRWIGTCRTKKPRVRIYTLDKVGCLECGHTFTREAAKHNYGFGCKFGKAIAKWRKQHRCAYSQIFDNYFFLPTADMNRNCQHYRILRGVRSVTDCSCVYCHNPSKDCEPETCPRMHHETPQPQAV